MADEMLIFTRTFDFLTWLLPATNHFPNAHRHSYNRRLLDAAFDLRERIEEANRSHGRASSKLVLPKRVTVAALRPSPLAPRIPSPSHGYRHMVVKKRWLIFAIGAVTLAVLAALAGWWLPPLLDFVGANSDLIQGMTDLAQLLLWMGAGAVVVIGWLLGRRAGQAPAQPAPVPSAAEAAGGSIVATEEGVAAGKLAVGGDVRGNSVVAEVYIDKVIADPNLLWQAIALPNPSSDLAEKTTTYLRYLVDQYRYLDFRGMGVTDRAPLRLALTDLYVPLKARIELPEGETWARNLRLAGRQMSEEEIAATGQRLSEPLPVIELLQQHDGLIVLGDPGAGKTTFLKYLALHMAQGRQDELGMAQRIPFLLPLSAYCQPAGGGQQHPARRLYLRLLPRAGRRAGRRADSRRGAQPGRRAAAARWPGRGQGDGPAAHGGRAGEPLL